MKKFFTVLGGMGTMATESYVRLLNKRTHAQKDQDYLNYILVNHATVPDRTEYILDHNKPNFLPVLIEDIKQQSSLHPEFMLIICNTAHYFYDQFQAATNVPILHMLKIAVKEFKEKYPNEKRVGLISTAGTLKDQIYQNAFKKIGVECITGDKNLQNKTMSLIYDYIKDKNDVNANLYHSILKEMHDKYKCNVITLGCTELSLAQELAGNHPYKVIDAQSIIVDKSIELGEAFRKSNQEGKKLLAKITNYGF
nr:amino acid racemase [uncultured Ligilactobacillus sp.]